MAKPAYAAGCLGVKKQQNPLEGPGLQQLTPTRQEDLPHSGTIKTQETTHEIHFENNLSQPQGDHHQADSTTVAQTVMPQPQEDHHQMDSTTTVAQTIMP